VPQRQVRAAAHAPAHAAKEVEVTVSSPTSHAAEPVSAIFSRVVVGVDGSEAGFEACRQAARLVDPGGLLEVFTAVHLVEATFAGWSASRIAEQLEREAGEASTKGQEIAGPRATALLVNGPPFPSLMDEVTSLGATLVAVGSHGHSRWSEILAGGVCGELLHGAPCSVLVARRPPDDAVFPRRIVVGYDGSPHADSALAVAEQLASRFGGSVRVVTALRGKPVDLRRAHPKAPSLLTRDDHPVSALVTASREADLLVVGSRGLHGFKALGSVSERVAHEAPCSVLVVRDQAA
jgi:nucleotide-binding universal stress UspA family protein